MSEQDWEEGTFHVGAAFRNLVHLKITCKMQCYENELFPQFFQINQFPLLEQLTLSIPMNPKVAPTLLDAVLSQPCYGLTHLDLQSSFKAQHLVDMSKFPNLKYWRLSKLEQATNYGMSLSGNHYAT